MKRAKPAGKITEVVDDMLDAVAGAEPLVFTCLQFVTSFFKSIYCFFLFIIVAIRSSYGCSISFSCFDFDAN